MSLSQKSLNEIINGECSSNTKHFYINEPEVSNVLFVTFYTEIKFILDQC